jgi:Rrf2 family transcriptional regulator, nitric oxide-sensitive transcriptional repressor
MFSLDTEYALRAMVHLAAHGPGFCPVPSIPQGHGGSSYLLYKVIASLRRARLVSMTRGRGGGVKLSRAAGEISLLQIVNATQSLERSVPMPAGRVGASLAPLHRKLDAIIGELEKRLSTTTLADVAPLPRPRAARRRTN